MHLYGGSINAFVGEESRYLDTLVALQLDDFAHLLVVNECAIAGKLLRKSQWLRGCTLKMDAHLLEGFQQLLGVIFYRARISYR